MKKIFITLLLLSAVICSADMVFNDRLTGKTEDPAVGEMLVYELSNGVLYLTNASGSPSFTIDILYTGNIYIANDGWVYGRNNADAAWVQMFKLNTSDEVEFGATIRVGTTEFEEDSGAVTGWNMPVSATPADGDEMSMSFAIDSNGIFKIRADADGVGGVDTFSALFRAFTDEDFILTFDGTTNDGTITYMEDEDRFDFDNDVDIVGDLTAGTVESDGILTSGGTFTQETYVIRKVISKTGMTDATATNVFTITTVTTEFGGYKCNMSIMAGDDMITGNANTAVMGLDAHFVRVIENSGNTGTTSGVAEISQTASANEGTGAVADITMTVVNTSETVQTIQANVDVSASGVADIVIIIELIYWDLSTAPVIAGS